MSREKSFVAVILLLFWLVLGASLRDKSLAFDELLHATAGYSYWRYGDYGFQPENGNLPQRLAGLPLALGSYTPPATDSPEWRNSQAPVVGYNWLYERGNDAGRMAASGRAACGLLAVALGALVWAWSRRLFGPAGGAVSLLLYVLSPTILANGGLMTSDTAAALFLLAVTGAWWAMLQGLSAGRLLGSALLAGGLFVSKASAVLIIPVVLVLAIARVLDGRPLPLACGRWRCEVRSRARQALAFALAGLAHAVVVVAVIWAFYGFRYSAFPSPAAGDRFLAPWEYVLDQPNPFAGASRPPPVGAYHAIDFLRRHELLPEAWLYGFGDVLHSAKIRRAFWNGEYSETGWPGFFPYTFLVKTPLSVFGVAALAVAAGWTSRKARVRADRDHGGRAAWLQLYPTLPLWALLAVYWLAAISSHLDIGHRHLLPVYAPMFVLCGAAAAWLRRGKDREFAPAPESGAGVPPAVSTTAGGDACATIRWPGVMLCALLVLLAAETAWRFPNYLAYFNGLVRPAEAYRHVVDSSLDWGQELPAARRYIAEHPEGAPYYLSYFGMASPAYYGISARLLFSFGGPYARGNPDFLMTRLPPDRVDEEVARLQRERTTYDLMGVGQIGTDVYAVFLKQASELRLAAGTYLISATMLQPVYYYGPRGPWNDRYEATYRRLVKQVGPLLDSDSGARAEAFKRFDLDALGPLLDQFEQYRLARLTSYLRSREPDANLNGAILVYRLTDADLARALD